MEILVCDIMGNRVYMSSFFKSDGNHFHHEVTPDKELARGIYFVIIRSGRQSLSRTFAGE